jgi:hypothetical protein
MWVVAYFLSYLIYGFRDINEFLCVVHLCAHAMFMCCILMCTSNIYMLCIDMHKQCLCAVHLCVHAMFMCCTLICTRNVSNQITVPLRIENNLKGFGKLRKLVTTSRVPGINCSSYLLIHWFEFRDRFCISRLIVYLYLLCFTCIYCFVLFRLCIFFLFVLSELL